MTGIGLGVGLGVGIPIILLLAALLFLKIRKPGGANKATSELPSYREEHPEPFEPMMYDKGRLVELPGEMSSQLRR